MFRRLAAMVLFTTLVMPVASALAEDDCNAECPAGKVKSSYLDGQHVTCLCVDQGSGMEDHPADGNPPAGGEGQEGEA